MTSAEGTIRGGESGRILECRGFWEVALISAPLARPFREDKRPGGGGGA